MKDVARISQIDILMTGNEDRVARISQIDILMTGNEDRHNLGKRILLLIAF